MDPAPDGPPDGRAYLKLILLGGAIGLPAALAAALFLALVHDLQHWLWHDLPEVFDDSSAPWFLVLGLPVVGALIVVVARLALPGEPTFIVSLRLEPVNTTSGKSASSSVQT